MQELKKTQGEKLEILGQDKIHNNKKTRKRDTRIPKSKLKCTWYSEKRG